MHSLFELKWIQSACESLLSMEQVSKQLLVLLKSSEVNLSIDITLLGMWMW